MAFGYIESFTYNGFTIFDLFETKWNRLMVIWKVEELERLLSEVEKNGRLRDVVARNFEGLVQLIGNCLGNDRDYDLFEAKWNRLMVIWKVQELEGLLSEVEKNGRLRDVVARNIEGLVQSTRSCLGNVRDNVSKFLDDQEECLKSLKSLITFFLDNLSSGFGFMDNALASAIVLSIVFQYLVGYVDKGGTKTYNPGSLEFRATYVSLLLFLGAYVWIKFRDVEQRTVRRRPKNDKFGKALKDDFGQVQYYNRWEPRFKPPRERGSGIPKHDYLSLGGYDTHRDAEVVCQIARFYYGKDERAVALADGSHFLIPVMSDQERSLCGEEKRKWVSAKAKVVFESFKEKAAREQPHLGAHAGDQVGSPASPSADQATRLSAHAGDQVDAPASPSADQAARVSAHAADQVDALSSPSAAPAIWLRAHDVDQVDAPASPSADQATWLSAHAGDQVDASPFADVLDAFALSLATTNGNDEFVERPAREHGLFGNIGDEEDLSYVNIPGPSIQEQLIAQLHLQKTQLEADFYRRFESLTEQHAEQYRRLDVEKSELRQEASELRKENSELRQENSELRGENSELRQENKRLKSQNHHLARIGNPASQP